MSRVEYIIGSSEQSLAAMPDKSVHFACTSPPYWALRNYSNLAGQHGLEKTPAEYIAQQMVVFDQLHRVLRDDGALVVNLGDTYAASPAGNLGDREPFDGGAYKANKPKADYGLGGIQQKSLCLIPYRFALAMLDSGWIYRNVIVWKKKSAMPTSARDRMRCSWEPVFVFVKRGKYYSDVEAVRVPHSSSSVERAKYAGRDGHRDWLEGSAPMSGGEPKECMRYNEAGANPGDVLTLGPQPSKIEHYAMYPVRLPLWFMRWLMPRKVCAECGMAWQRVVEKGELVPDSPEYKPRGRDRGDAHVKNAMVPAGEGKGHPNFHYENQTLRWQPQCECVPPDEIIEHVEPLSKRTRKILKDAGDDKPAIRYEKVWHTPPPSTGPTILDCYSGPGTTAAAAEYLWTHKAEGYDTVLTDSKMVATRPAKTSKHHEGDGSQRPEYAKARMVRTGTPTNVYCEWLPGKALMLDLDPAVELLYPQRKVECFNALSDGPGMRAPDTPLFTTEAQ